MAISFNELIAVGVVFDRGRVTPAWFQWAGRRYSGCRVTMRWQTREGSALVLHLAVTTDNATCFELTFNQQTLTWRLAAVDEGG